MLGGGHGCQEKVSLYQSQAPHGTIYALESLEAVLIGAAFKQDVTLAFIDDGVFQLMAGQNTAAAGMKNFSCTFKALGDYDVHKFYVERESLAERGLTIERPDGARERQRLCARA